MRSPAVRFVIALLFAELVPILVLFAVVAIAGPADAAAASDFAGRAGRWVGPIAGFVCTLLGALWVGRASPAGALRIGCLLGIAVALLDAAILLALGAGFEWTFLVSNLGKVVAGTLGGLLASRGAHRAT